MVAQNLNLIEKRINNYVTSNRFSETFRLALASNFRQATTNTNNHQKWPVTSLTWTPLTKTKAWKKLCNFYTLIFFLLILNKQDLEHLYNIICFY